MSRGTPASTVTELPTLRAPGEPVRDVNREHREALSGLERLALAAMGCDVVQGYVVGRPVPVGQLLPALGAGGWVLPAALS